MVLSSPAYENISESYLQASPFGDERGCFTVCYILKGHETCYKYRIFKLFFYIFDNIRHIYLLDGVKIIM